MWTLLTLSTAFALTGSDPTPTGTQTDSPPVADVAIVPGCPTEDDGRLSRCLDRRAAWAAHLYRSGQIEQFITSGSAVYNRFVEAEALARAMVARGVPEANILIEDQALHTDENMGYAVALATAQGFETFAVASVMGHAHIGCGMLKGWGHDCTVLSIDERRISELRKQGPDEVSLTPVAEHLWLSLDDRAAREASYAERPPSLRMYAWRGLTSSFVQYAPPAPPKTR